LPVFKNSEMNNTAGATFAEAVEAFERNLLSDSLSRHSGNLSQTAQNLGMAKTTLFDKVKKYGLS
jgi:two-component system response regulator AauR